MCIRDRIGSHICRVDWHSHGWPCETLNGRFRIARYLSLLLLSTSCDWILNYSNSHQTFHFAIILQLILRRKFLIASQFVFATFVSRSPRTLTDLEIAVPFRPIKYIWAMMIFWRVRGKITKTFLYCTVYWNWAKSCAFSYEHFLQVNYRACWFRLINVKKLISLNMVLEAKSYV